VFSIKGLVKFLNELRIDGEVEGTIDSIGTLTLGEHALIRGEIRTKSVKMRGTVEGNICVTERCELQAGCTLRGDIEAPRLMVDENATFVGSAKVGRGSHSLADVRSGACGRSQLPPRANHPRGIGATVSRERAKFFSRSHDAVIRVYDEAGNVIVRQEHAGKEW